MKFVGFNQEANHFSASNEYLTHPPSWKHVSNVQLPFESIQFPNYVDIAIDWRTSFNMYEIGVRRFEEKTNSHYMIGRNYVIIISPIRIDSINPT